MTSITELQASEAALENETRHLANIENITPADDARLDVAITELQSVRRSIKIEELRLIDARTPPQAELWADGVGRQNGRLNSFNVNRGADATGDEGRGRQAVESNFRAGVIPDHAAEKATDLIGAGKPGDRSLAGRWAAAAGSAAYRSAFAKLASDPGKGHLLWTAEEGDAYRQAAAVGAEMEGRAMSTTANAGGAMIPLSLDPAIMLTSAGSNNPLRQIATVRQTMTNTWQGVSSAGATSEWKGEAVEAADGSPVLASPKIDIFTGDTFVPYSFEVGDDAMSFLSELSRVMADSADNLMATAYTTGSGVGEPQGIVTGLAGTSSQIAGDGSEALIDADAYKLQNTLPARFSANASWQAHIATMNAFRRFETSAGAIQFPELRENPPHLLGKPFYENSNMDGTIDAAATASNLAVIYGDVAAAFVIVDRVGSRVEFIENLMGANNRPTGQRGAFLWFRTGSGVVNVNAARVLNVATTA